MFSIFLLFDINFRYDNVFDIEYILNNFWGSWNSKSCHEQLSIPPFGNLIKPDILPPTLGFELHAGGICCHEQQIGRSDFLFILLLLLLGRLSIMYAVSFIISGINYGKRMWCMVHLFGTDVPQNQRNISVVVIGGFWPNIIYQSTAGRD